MNKKVRFLILALIIISVTSLVGCGKSQSTTSKVSKQELNMPIESEPDSLDLAKVSDTYSALVGSQIIEGLTTVEIENDKEVAKPALAESWTTSKDQLKWTFKLRDAKWSDGVEVKSEDFVYGITRILDPKTASPISSNIKFIKNAQDIIEWKKDISDAGIKAIDENTLEITLEYPVPYFLSAAAGTAMFPVRKDILEKHGVSYGTEANNLVFCGPFVLDEWVHNSKLSFSKNPNYWDEGNVKLEKVNMKIISEENALIGEFENEKIDFVNVSSAEQIKKLSENKEYIKKTVDLPRTQYIFFNQKTPIFSNEKLRQAFSVALNREEISHDIFKDIEPAAYGWLPPSMDVDGENFRKLAGDPIKELISETKDPKDLLIKGMEEAGLGKDPSSIKIQLMCKNTSKDFAEYLQQHFKKTLGVNIVIDPVEWPVLQERNRALNYEMSFKSYGGDYSDPASMMDLWMTGKKTVPTAWSNKEYDDLINEASKSTDKELRKNNFVKAEKILIKDNATIVPFAYSQSNTFAHTYVKNLMEPSFTATVLKHVYIEK